MHGESHRIEACEGCTVQPGEEHMFDGRWRTAVDAKTGPVGSFLASHGVTADVLTATGLVSASLTAVAIATGHLHLAVILLIVTGMHDLLDGPVAKAAGTTSMRGAFFDSVTDRVADALLMGGVAWYLISQGEGHLVLLPFAIMAVTALVSYQRAKAEALGLSAKGGLMERAERMILLGFGLLVSAWLVPVLWVLLALTTVTAIGRFVKVWKAASDASGIAQRQRAAVLEARWREWRTRASSEWQSVREDSTVARWRARRLESPARTTRSRRSAGSRRSAQGPHRSSRP